VRGYFNDQVFETIVPRNIRLAEAPSHGLPISAYFPNSPGAEAYKEFAQEVLEQDGKAVGVAS
jgi:chromosome partitioning protein